MTELVFRADAYAQGCDARVIATTARGGIVLDRTVFYAAAGGQPGDKGQLEIDGFGIIPIATAVYGEDKSEIVHVPPAGAVMPDIGTRLRAMLDWETRYRYMRVHTALHLLCTLIPFPVTGGQIAADGGRLDFDIPDMGAVDREAIDAGLARLVAGDHEVSERFITDEEMAARPELVRTMRVKPPAGTGRVRLVAIGPDGAIDLQPCGGTHVRSTAEIGRATLGKIESKGKQNRRIRIVLG